jgi:gliding motility-associated-like protein
LVSAFSATSQEIVPTKGKEFWVGFLENWAPGGAAEALDLFITSDVNTSGTVTLPQQGWSLDFDVVANQTTTVNIPNGIAESFDNGVVDDKGIFVETADTVSVFAINMEQYTADGTKILPVQSLGTEYLVAAYFGIGTPGAEFMVVATQDGTIVEITPTEDTMSGQLAGDTFTIYLDAGETYMVQTDVAQGDLTGSLVKGTPESGDCRPFAVFGGCYCTNVPEGCGACDHIYDQMFPVNFWGTDYFTVPFNFTTNHTYKVLASVDNTDITIDGALVSTLNAGEYIEYNDVSEPHCVEGSNPISVIQFMEGINCAGEGDPAMLVLNDKTQKIDNVTFSTVESTILNQHSVSLVTPTDDIDQVTLDGVLLDPAIFNQIAACPDHSYAQFEITEGSHTLISPAGFTAYIYGNGFAESYAYSAGSFVSLDQVELLVDSVVCTSDSVFLQTDATLFDIYWYAQSNPDDIIGIGPLLILTPPITPDVYVAVGNLLLSGCESEQLFLVEVPDPPSVTAQTFDTEICQYESVQLSVDVDPPSGVWEYTWTPAAGLDNPNSATPIATPLESIVYEVLVSSPTGCASATSTVAITVLEGNLSGVEAETDDDLLCAGESAGLSVTVDEVVWEDNFDPGVSWGVWCEVLNGTQSTDCGSVTGNALYFNGAGQRSTTTEAIDVSTGGVVSFTIKFGTGAFPCDDSQPGESVVLEYSTTGCDGPFTQIQILAENGFPVFETVTLAVPAGAQTAATHFRWRQMANSGDMQDNWALDDVYITSQSGTVYDYLWTPNDGLDDDESQFPEATPDEDITYYVELTDVFNGCSYIDSVAIQVGQPFTLEITQDTTLCDVQGIELEVVPDEIGEYSYLWSPNDGTLSSLFSDSPTASPVATTTYDVTVTSEEGCEESADVTIVVNQLLDLSVTTSNNDFCQGEAASLEAVLAGNPSDMSFVWSPSDFLTDPFSSNPTATPIETTLYEVVVTDTLSGCSLSDEIEITVFSAFSIESIADDVVCSALGIQLTTTTTAQGQLIWNWEPAANVDNPAVASPNIILDETAEFIVTATDFGGCQQVDTVQIDVIFETFDLGNNVDICIGETVTLESGFGAGYAFEWSTNEITPTINVNQSGTYSLIVTAPEGCEVEDEVDVTVHDLPEVDLGPNQSLCEGDEFEIESGVNNADYEWSTDETTESIVVDQTGEYSVEVTDQWDCVNSDDVYVAFNVNPVINLPDSVGICEDEVVVLDAENLGSQYVWSNDQDSQVITVNQSGTYTVTVTNIWDCSSQDETVIDVYTYPPVNLGDDVSMCYGEFVVFDASSPQFNVNWSTGENSQTITVSSSGAYEVTVDNDYCYSTDLVNVVVNPLPLDQLGPDTVVCFTEVSEHTLDAGNPGALFYWGDSQATQYIDVTEPGYYTVLITTPFGCEDAFAIEVEELCPGQLYIPNSFSPNDDGINDAFFAYGMNIIEFRMEIWNRWGEVIHVSEDLNIPWDGSVDGGDYYVENEVYVYVITYKYLLDLDGTPSDVEQVKGHVTVVR